MIPSVRKIISHLLPIKLSEAESVYSGIVKLYLYKGEIMLCTRKATYSHGLHYAPFLKSFDWLHKKNLLHVSKYLSLGGGLAASSYLLFKKYGLLPETTIVEIEPIYKEWCKKYLPGALWQKINWVVTGAQHFLLTDSAQFDLITIDLFIEMGIPEFVLNSDFIDKVDVHLTSNGIVIMNLYTTDSNTISAADAVFFERFQKLEIIHHGDNYFLIGRKK